MKMKKQMILSLVLGLPIVGLFLAAGAEQECHVLMPVDYPDPIQNSSPQNAVKKKKADRIVSEAGFLYEDFESASGKDPFPMPEGWVSVPTPGIDNDEWRCGTLSVDGEILRGVSGYKYAYIFPNADSSHDAWTFSPSVRLEAGKEYNVELYVRMPAVQGVKEILEVKAGMGANAGDMTVNIGNISGDYREWTLVSGAFTPEESGLYNIGLHSASPAGGGGTVVDNLKVWSGDYPSFTSHQGIDFGVINTLQPAQSTTLEIYNPGTADLTVDLKECSEGISVSGFPATVAPDELKEFPLTLNVSTPGNYVGEVVLTTNDPICREPRIMIFAEVREPRVTGFDYEDFEHGGPQEWTFTETTGNVPNYGMDSGRSWWGSSFYSIFMEEGVIGFTTHYVEMGDDPVFSFCYKLNVKDQQNHPISPEVPRIVVKASDDYGKTWSTVYTIEPGGEDEHVATVKYRKIEIPLPEYKNSTCCFKVGFSHASGDLMEAMNDPYDAAVDNVAIGTLPLIKLEALYLDGSALSEVGGKCQFMTSVENRGRNDADTWSVDLIDNASGAVVKTVEGKSLASGEKTDVVFDWTPESAGAFSFHTVVRTSGEVAESSMSNSIFVEVLGSDNQVHAIQEGESKKSFSFPVDFYGEETMGQTIYKANEIGVDAGLISSLVYKTIMNSAFLSDSFDIYVGETDKENFDDCQMLDVTTLTKVFEGGVYFPQGRNDFVVPFFTPYEYKGGNLVVCSVKKSKEFIYDKNFVNRLDKSAVRSLSRSTDQPGSLDQTSVISTGLYPDIRINMVSPATGSISGKVTDVSGNAISGARVEVGGTQLYCLTDKNGSYSLPCVTVGQHSLTATHHDYSRADSEAFVIEESSNSVVDITMSAITSRTLRGKVVDQVSGEPVAGVGIVLNGYDEFSTVTDGHGLYEISGVKQIEQPYVLRTSSDWYVPSVHAVSVGDSDIVLDLSLSPEPVKAFGVKVSAEVSGAEISWSDPLPEYRHDSGNLYSVIGYVGGWKEIIFGTSFKKKARVKEISWYAASGEEHSGFNVFVFGLDNNGNPDPNNILYNAYDVEYTDDAWSTHRLDTPVEADGFMIAVSCNGFMSIGITKPTEQYPFELNTCFYAGDSYKYRISEMATYEECHLMLRATCEDVVDDGTAVSRPDVSYKVFRMDASDPESQWTLIGETDGHAITDKDFGNLPVGSYRYAVVSVYGNGEEGRPEYSETIWKNGNSIDLTECPDGVAVGPCPFGDRIVIEGAGQVSAVEFVSLSGALVKRIENPDRTVDTSDIPRGFCLIRLTLRDGMITTVKSIKK